MTLHLRPSLAALAALLAAGAGLALPGAATAETADVRVGAMAERGRVVVYNSSRRTQLNVTLDREGLPLAKAILVQDADQPEVHLEALLSAVVANPRAPLAARETTAALYTHGVNQDVVASLGQPFLALEVDAGAGVLRVDNLAGFLPGATPVSHLQTADLDALLDPREYNLDGASARALGALVETVRGELSWNGARCDGVARIFSLFPGAITVHLAPRCPGWSGPPQGALVFAVSGIGFDADGSPRVASLELVESTLAPPIAGGLRLVPRLREGELWTSSSPGLLFYGADESGPKTIDFAALLSGAGVGAPCVPSGTTLCLDRAPGDDRFQVTLSWFTAMNGGLSGDAMATPLDDLGVGRGGLFSFFPNNPEVLVKVLDGCGIDGHFWVFVAPTTTLGYTIEVIDTVARAAGAASSVYRYVAANADGNVAESFADTGAFTTCSF